MPFDSLSLQIYQPNYLATIGIPMAIAIFIGILSIVGVFLTAKFASDRFLKNHENNERTLVEEFKIATIERITAIEKGNINWPEFENHRRENNDSIRRVHEKIEDEEKTINKCMNTIKQSVNDIKTIVLVLKSAFDEHKEAIHKV